MDLAKTKEMTNAEYHGDTSRISKSGLDLIEQSPLHYWHKYLSPNRPPHKETLALFNGTAIHTAVLEPQRFREQYVCWNDIDLCAKIGGASPRSTTKYKEAFAEFKTKHATKLILDWEVWNMCIQITKNVHASEMGMNIMREGYAEKTLLFKESVSGAPCKVRPDWLTSNGFIMDIKSTEDASPSSFAKSCANYRYDVASAFYSDGFNNVFGQMPEGFIFIAVEKSPPYAVAFYFAPPEMIESGRQKYQANCNTYMEALHSNKWEGYPDMILPVELPGWYLKKQNQF